MNETDETPLLDAILRIDKLPANGRRLSVSASPAQCAAIAQQLALPEIERLSAKLVATSFRGGVRVLGQLEANVVQSCVVTQEPVAQRLSETVDRIFLPGAKKEDHGNASDVFVDLEGDDIPDYYEGTELDLTELLLEVFSLALDPYPRKPDADIGKWLKPKDQEELPSPFSKLKALKTNDD